MKAQVTESEKFFDTTDINEAAALITTGKVTLHDMIVREDYIRGRTRTQTVFVLAGPEVMELRAIRAKRELKVEASELLYIVRLLKAMSHNKINPDHTNRLETTDINEAAIFVTSGAAVLDGLEVREDTSGRGSRKQTVFIFVGNDLNKLRLLYVNKALVLNEYELLHNLRMLKTMSHDKLRPQNRVAEKNEFSN